MTDEANPLFLPNRIKELRRELQESSRRSREAVERVCHLEQSLFWLEVEIAEPPAQAEAETRPHPVPVGVIDRYGRIFSSRGLAGQASLEKYDERFPDDAPHEWVVRWADVEWAYQKEASHD